VACLARTISSIVSVSVALGEGVGGAGGQPGSPWMMGESAFPMLAKSMWSRKTVHDWTGCVTETACMSRWDEEPSVVSTVTRPEAEMLTTKSSCVAAFPRSAIRGT